MRSESNPVHTLQRREGEGRGILPQREKLRKNTEEEKEKIERVGGMLQTRGKALEIGSLLHLKTSVSKVLYL